MSSMVIVRNKNTMRHSCSNRLFREQLHSFIGLLGVAAKSSLTPTGMPVLEFDLLSNWFKVFYTGPTLNSCDSLISGPNLQTDLILELNANCKCLIA